jgi:hypothetical protein
VKIVLSSNQHTHREERENRRDHNATPNQQLENELREMRTAASTMVEALSHSRTIDRVLLSKDVLQILLADGGLVGVQHINHLRRRKGRKASERKK